MAGRQRDARHGGAGDLLARYLEEAAAFPLLDAAEERALGRAVAAGRVARAELDAAPPGRLDEAGRRRLLALVEAGDAARERFIQCNLRLVVSIAKRYRGSSLPLLDLVQEGNLGLMRAVEGYDPDRGFRFSTYATWWIRQAVGRAVDGKASTIRVPASAPADARRADAVLSLSAPAGEDRELSDVLVDEAAAVPFDVAAAVLDQEAVHRSLARLAPREREVLEARFGLTGATPRTLEDVGRDLAVTRERVRQIEAKALTKLRHPCTPRALRDVAGR